MKINRVVYINVQYSTWFGIYTNLRIGNVHTFVALFLKGLVHDWQRVADFSYNCAAEHCHLQVKDLARILKKHLLMEDSTSVNTCIQWFLLLLNKNLTFESASCKNWCSSVTMLSVKSLSSFIQFQKNNNSFTTYFPRNRVQVPFKTKYKWESVYDRSL